MYWIIFVLILLTLHTIGKLNKKIRKSAFYELFYDDMPLPFKIIIIFVLAQLYWILPKYFNYVIFPLIHKAAQ